MERSYFFNSIDGDRKYKAGDLTRFFGALVNDGILPNPSTNLQVVAGDDMSVVIKAGFMWINSGHLYWNDSDRIISLGSADGVMNRIDRIVIRWMNTERDIRAYAVSSTLVSNPTAPAIQRDADYYEMCLADVAVNAGTTQIIQANITDQRLSTALCGVASATYDTIDTETLNAQLQSWYNTFTAESQANFETWFTALGEVLDTNTATNLYNEIMDRIVGPPSSTTGHLAKYLDETGKSLGDAAPHIDYAPHPETVTATLTAAGWVDNEQTLMLPAVYMANAPGDVRIAGSATDQEFAAWVYAMPRKTGQSQGSITIRLIGDVPVIDIPVEIEVR